MYFFYRAVLIVAMHVLKISYLPVLLQYITGSDVILLSINTVTAIVVIHISFHMYMYILHAAESIKFW